jgi:ketosteroid isomerase-like protein
MIRMLGVFLLIDLCFSTVYGQEKNPAASSTAEAIIQIERDWLNAEKSNDVGKLTQIIADDWVSVGPDGVKETKAELLKNIKSGESEMAWFEMGPVDVKVIGTVAIAQGSDTEKSSYKGKDTSGKLLWTDVFVNRNGKWQAVRSQMTLLK